MRLAGRAGFLTVAAMLVLFVAYPQDSAPPSETKLPALIGIGQDYFHKAPPADPDAFTISSDVELVLLDVSVKDSEGGFVSGLSKDSFRIYDEGKPVPITVFASQDAPVTVGLVVDNSGSVRPKRPEVVTAALTFVQRSNPHDEMFVVNFNDSVWFGLPPAIPFSDNIHQLRSALLSNPTQGRTALYDAVKAALIHLEKGRMDKKTLVVISDGGDNASETSEKDVVEMAERSLATIYTIGIYDPDAKDKNPGFLKKLANLTGGLYFHPQELRFLVRDCEQIAKDIRSRYTLGFVPAAHDDPGQRRVRRIKVIATGENQRPLKVRTRTHYVAGHSHVKSRSQDLSRGEKRPE
jgi:VWFA-related protein